MKTSGIINGELARALATLRHTDLFAVSDAGFPAGPRAETIDLAVIPGVPDFDVVFGAILQEVIIEDAWIAAETDEINPSQAAAVRSRIGRVQSVPHAELKRLSADAVFVVRTGDKTPYSNILLKAGYPF